MGRMGREKKRHKSNETRIYPLEAAERKCKIRQDEVEEEASGRYHGYSAGTAYSAARLTAVTNAETATATAACHFAEERTRNSLVLPFCNSYICIPEGGIGKNCA